MNTQIIDGFVWGILDKDETTAEDCIGSTYCLYPDGTEALIETNDDFQTALEFEIAVEVGREAQLKSDWQEACARNNETRSFNAWLESLAETLIN